MPTLDSYIMLIVCKAYLELILMVGFGMYQIRDKKENKIIARFIDKVDARDFLKTKNKGKDKERYEIVAFGGSGVKKEG